MDEKHIADYFIISGVPENPEFNTESKQLISSVLPITDITVIFRGLGEQCPIGYTCIETTPGGHLADLNNGNFKSPNIQICYRRGDDKPPLVDVGVYHEDKERVLSDVEVVYTTPYGRCASTGNNSSKSGTFITYRRAKTNSPYNQLVVVDLCVILNNKSEHPPHAFYSIKKNLNKSYYGMIGSEVFLCYKKTLLSPPSLCYTPQIISRFPLQDYANSPLPDTVPLFCLPAGANIELWPINTPLPRPVASTFVLTSDSAQKNYGSALSFYEPFDHSQLTPEQKARLGPKEFDEENRHNYETYAIKSICILSRWPFFDCFEKFLMFLHRLVFNPKNSNGEPPGSPQHRNHVPLEHHISHFLLDVSFPTPQRPTVLVQLTPGTDETVTIRQPSSRLPLPLTGASFIRLLTILGVDNTMNVLLFGLTEQKILLHSLRPWVLTGVAEAITAMLFPFYWQCPYVPLCPLSLHGILNAPLPFIVGIDSRCFDTFTPPDDIICIDLDTQSIFLSELKKCLNLRILPKRAARVLRNSLEKIFQKVIRLSQASGSNQSPQHRYATMEASRQQLERNLELEIQESFVRFMATILRGFRSYLLPITRAPTVGATDPTSLFNFEGFLLSRDRNYCQFYQLITKTQMFTHYIEERSFVSDKDTSLAFFDDCEEKLTSSDDIFSDRPIKLFDKDDSLIQTDRSVYIPAPEQSPSVSHNNNGTTTDCLQSKNIQFGPLNAALFHRHPQLNNFPSLDRAFTNSACIKSQLLFDNYSNELYSSFSISRRTEQEVKASRKLAKKSFETPLNWSRYLVSCCYCLWFSTLPSYIAYCKTDNDLELDAKYTSRILRYAYSTIVRMQKLQLTTDEICFRVLTLLCCHYGQPALAVRVFFEMKKAGIKPNAVTYGYYNKAVLESKWPDHASKPTTVLWTKIRNVISGIALFKTYGKIRQERLQERSCLPLIGDPSFGRQDLDVVDRSATYNGAAGDLIQSATLPQISDQFDGGALLKNITSTPNFKRLINDASSVQWSKWTPSSQNSKNVYKGIVSAATGIVSSLQEIKSSFSISNSNTPSKLLTTAHHRSTATREMLSQWANYFSTQPARCDDSDNSSLGSNDIRLSNDEDAEAADDFKHCQRLFETIEKYSDNSSSKEDLIGHLSDFEPSNDGDRIAIEVKMNTCSKCDFCHSMLFDEEIMERWSHHESNLNTRCAYCGKKIVPLMTVQVDDRRFEENERNENCDATKTNGIRGGSLDSDQQLSFTVPYLSPIVLRKELESVFESSGDSCLANSQFVDEHPIIFWNLLWYLSRINTPTHLAFLCLNSKSILNGKEDPTPRTGSSKVVVRTLWDNENLLAKHKAQLQEAIQSQLIETSSCGSKPISTTEDEDVQQSASPPKAQTLIDIETNAIGDGSEQ